MKAISLYFVRKHNLSTESYIAVFRTEEQFINWQLYHFMSCQTTIYQPIALFLYFVPKAKVINWKLYRCISCTEAYNLSTEQLYHFMSCQTSNLSTDSYIAVISCRKHNLSAESCIAVPSSKSINHQLKAISLYFVPNHKCIIWKLYRCTSYKRTIYQLKATYRCIVHAKYQLPQLKAILLYLRARSTTDQLKAISLCLVPNHNLSTESYIAVFHADEQFINLKLYNYISYEASINELKAMSMYFVPKNNFIKWKVYRCISYRWTIYQLKVISL